MRTGTYACQGVRKVSFPENFAIKYYKVLCESRPIFK